MRDLPQNAYATNLSELWWDEDKERLLRLSGVRAVGSDYERFLLLCRAAEQFPTLPMTEVCRKQLDTLFHCKIKLNSCNADAIWHFTADALLLHPVTRADAAAAGRRISTEELQSIPAPARYLPQLRASPSVFGASKAEHWETLKKEATAELALLQAQGRVPTLALPAAFQYQKPSLYAVNRHLGGGDCNPNLILSQEAAFLRDECNTRTLPLLIRSDCPASALATLLQALSRRAALPPILWHPTTPPTLAEFLLLCETAVVTYVGALSS